MTLTDMAGRPVRDPGTTGRGRRRSRSERAAASRAAREAYWARRIAATSSPVQLLRVLADRASTAAVQQERRAAVAVLRARKGGDQARTAEAEHHLSLVRSQITADLQSLIDALTTFADTHETLRA